MLPPRVASGNQTNFIRSLYIGRDVSSLSREQHDYVQDALSGELVITMEAASKVINALADLPEKSANNAPLEPGMYKSNNTIFKVQIAVHGSGKPYAKRLEQDEDGAWGFVYAPGAVKNLSPDYKMSLEDAKQFGVLYGTCCVCGRMLTNESSIADGIGPVCAKRF